MSKNRSRTRNIFCFALLKNVLQKCEREGKKREGGREKSRRRDQILGKKVKNKKKPKEGPRARGKIIICIRLYFVF